jgi:hypothetical protein
MHSGDGPCRQGLYVDVCKLHLHKIFGNGNYQELNRTGNFNPIGFLENFDASTDSSKDYLNGVEDWVAAQAYHIIIIKSVMESLFISAASNCRNEREFNRLEADYYKLKKKVFELIEVDMKPSTLQKNIVRFFERRLSVFSGISKYFCYGLYNNNGLRKIFRKFSTQWNHENHGSANNGSKVGIHVDGEIYLRLALIEKIQKSIIESIGFNSFNLSYTPMWSYFEYILENRNLISRNKIRTINERLNDGAKLNGKAELLKTIKINQKNIKKTKNSINILRNVLAKPLYEAAGIEMPHSIKKEMEIAAPVLPTLKPEGELVPYVGMAISQLNNGIDLFLNVGPEGCMVSSLGEMLTPKIMEFVKSENSRIQHLFTTEGEIDEDLLRLSLLKIMGTEKYYSCSS